MPRRSLKPCAEAGCPNLTAGTRCEAHKGRSPGPTSSERRAKAPWERFYGSPEWLRARTRVLAEEPTCPGYPEGRTCGKPTTTVDHKRRFKPSEGGNPLERSNLQAFCSSCHGRKSHDERKAG